MSKESKHVTNFKGSHLKTNGKIIALGENYIGDNKNIKYLLILILVLMANTVIAYSSYSYSDISSKIGNSSFNPGIYCSDRTNTENELLQCLATVMQVMKDKELVK